MTTVMRMTTLAVLLTLTACNHAQREEFRAERSEKRYQEAMADYTAGHLDAAEEGFRQAIKANPANASARFQLAVLLQEKRQDYLAAVCCYRDFLLIASESDKARLARDRATSCERLLAKQLAEKMNYSDSSELMNELKLAIAAKDKAEQTNADLQRQVENLQRELAVVKKESDQRKALLDRLGADDDDEPRAPKRVAVEPVTASEARAATPAEQVARAAVMVERETVAPNPVKPIEPVVEESKGLTLNPEALALHEEEEQAEAASSILPAQTKENAAAVKLTDLGKKPQPAAPPSATGTEKRPKTYTVQPGESLSQIALRYYGKKSYWKKIQQANKALVPITGDVKAGQVLILP